jgi:hypothetical protein
MRIWETLNNPHFNYGEFAIIRRQAELNNYKLSVREWIEKTDNSMLDNKPQRRQERNV